MNAEHAPHVDVLIVGAGLSGVGMACHLTRERPGSSYAIVEARHDLGGTWDLFRYPGVRSDSDMYTLGYDFEPWASDVAIADGADIKAYIERTAERYDVLRHVTFGRRVTGASWDSATSRWTVTTEPSDGDPRGPHPDGSDRAGDPAAGPSTFTCRWLQMCSGYYSYTSPHRPSFEGEGEFGGRIVHPQEWPRDLSSEAELRDRRVVVIGSGATAVTLVPALADLGATVTMLQRSPTWIVPMPNRNPITIALRKVLPERAAYRAIRWINAWRGEKIYETSRTKPEKLKALIHRQVAKALGGDQLIDPHFTPSYDPWDQRLCLAPDGDIFGAIRAGRAEVVTDRIERFDATGIALASGRHLDADVIVTATGLELLALGGVTPEVDGRPVELAETFTYKSFMYSGVPNLGTTFGYINASWTLRADLVARYVCRLLDELDERGVDRVEPVAEDPEMTRRPYVDGFPAGYMQRSIHLYPKQSDRDPWTASQSFSHDRDVLLAPDAELDDGVLAFGAPARVPTPA